MKIKQRLDHILHERFPRLSKTYLQSLVMQGKVKVKDEIVTKAGTQLDPDVYIEVDLKEPKYVSRAGLKLEKALDHFDLDPRGLIVLDAGLSTGGFTDCLLQRDVAKVYGIDVGYGQVHEKIRKDPRVIVMERTNLRKLEHLPDLVDLVTLDLSFISVLKVIQVVVDQLKPSGKLILLVKPQFEAEKHQVGKGGIIKDPAIHQLVIDRVVEGIKEAGFDFHGIIESPILGTEGNKEFLAYFTKSARPAVSDVVFT